MSVGFKKVLRKNPQDENDKGKYYPQLVVLGKPATIDTISAKMKDKSSLSKGDIRSVLINFVEVMREELFNGHSVSIKGFGTFSLSATADGVDEKKDCLPGNITLISINFRAANDIRPSMSATRSEDKIDFVDVETIGGSASNGGTGPEDGSDDTSGEDPGGSDSGNTDSGGGSSSGGSGTGDDEVEQL